MTMGIEISRYKNIVILTGAGISVASGLRTYRGAGGVWDEHNVEEYGHIDRLKDAPSKLWELFGPLRLSVSNAEPNRAHYALAQIENKLRTDQNFLLITQNVDGLHQKSGSKNVVELHGNISKTFCSNDQCDLTPFDDNEVYAEAHPVCSKCGSPLRPSIVLFGEAIPPKESWLAKRALRDCDLFIAIGTSGTVSPASNFVRSAEYAGARTIYINVEAMEPPNPAFQETYLGKAEELLPDLFQV